MAKLNKATKVAQNEVKQAQNEVKQVQNEVDFSTMTATEIQKYFADKLKAEAETFAKTKTIGISKLDYAYKYMVVGEIYKASKLGNYITFKELHEAVKDYDIKGLSRDINTNKTRVYSNIKTNLMNGNKDKAETLSIFWSINKKIAQIEADTISYLECINEDKSYNVDKMKMYKFTPRDILRFQAINDAIEEFKFSEVIIDFNSLNEEVKGKSGTDLITYKHNNEVKILFGFELLKAYLLSYGATLKDLNEVVELETK